MTFTSRLSCVLIVSFAAIAPVALAQMQGFAAYKGERLPISTYHDDYILVIKGDSTQLTYDLDIEVRPASRFAEGNVTISEIAPELDLLRNASPKDRANPSAIRAQYRAKLTADRALSDCYGLLTFVTQGSVGTRLVAIGSLGAGSTKNIEVKLRSDVSSFGSLHVFSKGTEVTSNQHPGPYDVIAYYASLVKDVKGVGAAELLHLEESYPHQLSADGRLLATLRKHESKLVMIVYDLETMKLISQTPVAGDDDTVQNLTWVSDHEVAYVAEGHDSYFDWNLHLLDIRAGTTRKVLENVIAIMQAHPDHPEVLEVHLVKNGSLFMKYNVLTGKTYEFEDPAAGRYLLDRQGKARVMFRLDEDRRLYEFRPTADAPWRDIDELVKQPGLKFNLKASDELDRVADIHSIGPDGDTLYISSRLGGDKFELAAFSMSQGVVKQPIAQHPKYDLTTSDNGLAHLLFAKNSPQLLGLVYLAQKPKVIWVQPAFAAAQKAIDATFPDHVNLPIDWSVDGGTMIYYSFSDQDPGTYYAFRPRKPEIIPLLELGERLKGRSLGKTTPIEFPARDGAKIPAYVTRPPTTEPTGLPPCIVIVHGGPMARDSWQYSGTNQFFATRGYVVLQVNYRGSSGYGAAFQAAGLRARLDTVVLDDIADGVRYLIDQKEVDPNRIAVMGASFGGWASYMCLAKYPDLFRAGVAISAVSSWKKALFDDRWLLSNRYSYSLWKTLLARQDYKANARYVDPIERVAEIKRPVLILHGERDRVVDATEAKMMLSALKKQGTPVEAKSFQTATHTWWSFGDRVEQLNEIASFLERHLPPATTTRPADGKVVTAP